MDVTKTFWFRLLQYIFCILNWLNTLKNAGKYRWVSIKLKSATCRETNSSVMYEACFADLELDYGAWVTLLFLHNIPPDLSIQGHNLGSSWASDGDGCPECHGCHISPQCAPSVHSTCCRGAFRASISCEACIMNIIFAQKIPCSLPC